MLETLDRKLICLFSNPFCDSIMTPKILKPHKIIMLCIVMALLVVPVVSARKEQSDDSGNNANNGATTTNYIVTPAQNIDQSMHLDSTQTIIQGQTITHNVNVGSGVKYLEADCTGDQLVVR